MSTVQRLPAALLAPLLTLMLLPVAMAAAASEPAQTAQQATISLVGDGPYYRLTLPTTIYAGAAHTDLRDVRDRDVVTYELPKSGQLLCPTGRVQHHLGCDAVDLDVEGQELGVARRRVDQPARAILDPAVANPHKTH